MSGRSVSISEALVGQVSVAAALAGLNSADRRDAQQSTEPANFPSDSFDIPDLHQSGFLRTDKRGELRLSLSQWRTDGLFESDLLREILILKLQL
jgi:hypothetical protein